ncbi:MAG: hypothetical protein LBH96_03605 [Candidatus Peribacteria bacterium]|jgi:hypothetical protein|nr:hypothetical protein [Candidatus Peribacteria bacterium]
MKLKYIAPETMGALEILDILDKNGKSIEKADCNMKDVYVETSLELKGWESIYVEPVLF